MLLISGTAGNCGAAGSLSEVGSAVACREQKIEVRLGLAMAALPLSLPRQRWLWISASHSNLVGVIRSPCVWSNFLVFEPTSKSVSERQ